MEIPYDNTWNLCWKEEIMAIRGNFARKNDSTQYSPNHVKEILKTLGLSFTGEASNNLIGYCPFHNNRNTPSFSISCENGLWLCYNPACAEAGTLVELVKKILNKNDFEALRYINSKESEALNNFDEILTGIMEEKPDFVEFPQQTLDSMHEELNQNSSAKEYFISRGILEESMDYFKLGFSSKQNMVIVPVHSPDGKPVGLVGRSISEKRFKNSTNLPRSKTMFNIHRAKKIGDHVIIVESSFDAIKVHQSGFPNVVATLGGHISNENLMLLNRYFNRITIMTDADQAGRELGISIANKLRYKNILWASFDYGKIYPHEAKDAGDMTEQEIKTCIKNAVSDIEYRSWK